MIFCVIGIGISFCETSIDRQKDSNYKKGERVRNAVKERQEKETGRGNAYKDA